MSLGLLRLCIIFASLYLPTLVLAEDLCRQFFEPRESIDKSKPGVFAPLVARKQSQSKAFFPLIEALVQSLNESTAQIATVAKIEASSVSMSNINPDSQKHGVESIAVSEFQNIERSEPPVNLLNFQRGASTSSRYIPLLNRNRLRSNVYLWRNIPMTSEVNISIFEYIQTPVGLNPPRDYFKLIVTTSTILKLIEENQLALKPIADEIAQSDITFGRKEQSISTSNGTFTKSDPAILALVEGVVSLHQYLTFLISSRTEKLTSSEVVMQLLEPNKDGRAMISGLTQMLPLALIGPFTIMGYSFFTPFKLGEDGRLRPKEEFIKFLQESKASVIPFVKKNGVNSHASCLGCPMVSKNENARGGIDLLAESYLSVYLKISEMLDNQ